MESQNSIMSKFVLVVALFFTTLSGTNAVQAAAPANEQPLASIRYIGKQADLLVFNVHFNYSTEGRFRILDEYGNVLFEEKVQPNATVKRFKIASRLTSTLHFESLTRGQNQRKTFAVAYQVEEKIHVSEVK